MISDKLNKHEAAVMKAVLTLSDGKENFLISPYDLLAILPPKLKYDEETLEHTLKDLEMDGYFELTASDRKGEKVYVVAMKTDGLNYTRADNQRKRAVYFKWGVAAVGAVIAALISVLIKALV